jgi:AGCS family alanine or glycine:cation symporter
MVLFYHIGSHEQRFVTMDHQEHFYRPAGTDGPFKRVSHEGTLAHEELTSIEAEGRKARGNLLLGAGDAMIRTGMLNGQKVEFIAEKIDVKSKYVLDPADGKYHKVKRRELLSQEPSEILSADDVARLARLDRLVVDEAKKKAGDPNPYIRTEAAGGMPLVVAWLVIGGVFFTFYMRGFNIWGFAHSIAVVRGKYDDPNEPGEVTHFQALASALSATVGLGNIAGVTIAMAMGGPGAFFWMMLCGIFGMSSKFVECTLGQKYRIVKPDGTVLGGPMQYLHTGLKELGWERLGFFLSIVFTVMCILASFGGGNMFQVNQSGSAVLALIQKDDLEQLKKIDGRIEQAAEQEDAQLLATAQEEKTVLKGEMDGFTQTFKIGYGLILAAMVGVVIIGGIRRIGAAAEKIVPLMCLIYVGACLYIILTHYADVPNLVATIFSEAFSGRAFGGGVVGVIVLGFRRAAFSNEAGVGSAAIAHSAAKTDEPIREGAVALMEPFIDTVVICSMTALVILITGAWDNMEWIETQGLEGAALTSEAFRQEISWFPWVLSISVVLFAYSTIISWSYYGERCWERFFGPRSTGVYKVLCITFVFIGSIAQLEAVLNFSDMMILSMAFPNILGLLMLSPRVKADLMDYWRRFRAGEFEITK